MTEKKYILLILLIAQITFGFCQSTVKQYFFGSEDFYKENHELIIIVKNPQTEFAENLGSRYYNDTSFIRKISTLFYTEVDTSNHDISIHSCGYDLYFYAKKNQNLFLIKAVNSSCNVEEIGIIDAKKQCENLELLATSGSQLVIDTLSTTIYPETKDSILKDVIYHRNVGIVEGNITSESFYYSGNNNSRNLPKWYYDYFVETSLQLDTSISISQNILNHLLEKGIDSVMYENVNWQIDSKIAEDIELCELFDYPLPNAIDLKFYITKDMSQYFENDVLNCQLPQIWTSFTNDTYKRILLFKMK